MDLKDIKLEYIREELNIEDLTHNPIDQMNLWLQEALCANISYSNAANLATVNKEGLPNIRTILVKDINAQGITFFTDYKSQKAVELEMNNKCSLHFFWKELDRQIRISGKASKLTREESETYFFSRARESQISAYASHQSKKTTKKALYNSVEKIELQFKGLDIPCPQDWGGFQITIDKAEFWQGRPNRLHDRFIYENINEKWNITRLNP